MGGRVPPRPSYNLSSLMVLTFKYSFQPFILTLHLNSMGRRVPPPPHPSYNLSTGFKYSFQPSKFGH